MSESRPTNVEPSSAMLSKRPQTAITQSHPVHRANPSLSLPVRRTSGVSLMGNQAAQRLLRDGVIQAKLTVNQPGDRFEQEADRVAETVMRMPDPGTGTPPSIQRMCTGCEEEVNRSQPPSLSTIDESVVARQIKLNDFAGSEPVEDTDEEARPIAAERKSAQGAVSQVAQQPTVAPGLA